MARKNKRDVLLTFTLILITFGYLKYLYLPFNNELVAAVFGHYPNWFPIWSSIALIIGIPTIYGLWNYKKWGIYLFKAIKKLK